MERDRKYYDREYVKKERSPIEIADEHGTYPNKIRRELRELGFQLRSRSQAQAAALRTGRHNHPTKGKIRDDKVRAKISRSRALAWSDSDRKDAASRARKRWYSMPATDRVKIRELASKAIRKASIEGSKLEHAVSIGLTDAGHSVTMRPSDDRFSVDMIVDQRVVIEIDGPSHFLPIWGEERLRRTMDADRQKRDAVLKAGYSMIRVKHIGGSTSMDKETRIIEEVVRLIGKRTKYQEIEVN